MCELLAISSLQPTRLTISLEALAAHSAEGRSTRDGWGVAFYQDHDVALFREAGAASNSALVALLETSGPATTMAISHIRHATQGAVKLANTQPFVRELAGRTHVFAHNGDLAGIARDPRFTLERFRPVGETDSEHAFCALLARMGDLWQPGASVPSLALRLALIKAFATELRELGPANFLYADGDTLFAHGHRRVQMNGRIEPPGLVVVTRRCAPEGESFQARGVSLAAGYQQVALVASVPLTGEAWRALAEGEVLALRAGEELGSEQ